MSLIILISFSSPLPAQKELSAIKSFSTCVAFLNDTRIETIKVDGEVFQVWLKKPDSNLAIPKTYRLTGTAFFVSDTFSNYLVTAEHVAREMTLNSDIVIHGQSDKPLVFKLITLAFRRDSLIWTFNGSSDVATLLLDDNSQIYRDSSLGSIPTAIIESDRIPLREREVTTIGFPLDLGYGKSFSPISKISRPSSGLIELPRFDNNKIATFYLLDDPSISGFSGSPVFELPTNLIVGDQEMFVTAYRLMGLVHGSISDKTGGGFAAIVPAKYIIETIKQSPKYSGVLKWFHENGKLWSERLIKDGRMWSVLNNFDKNGKSVETGTLKDGNGTLYIYDEDGKLLSIDNYLHGLPLNKVSKEP
ncbi:MAG: hypothetical protein ABSF91_11560 [Bacteroidota bacterium]